MDEKEKLADMADKKPRKALIYGMGIVIVFLTGWAGTLFIKLESAKENAKIEQIAALDKQSIEYKAEIKEARQEATEARKETKECRDQVVSRTDMFVDKITNNYQKQIDEVKRIELERTRLSRVRSGLITKDQNNLNELNKSTN
jgi:uncharacterized transporter YbjL